MAASAVAILVGNPLWVIRTRIMAQPLKTAGPSLSHSSYHYTSVLHGLKSIVKHEGWTALYKGLGPSFLGISHVAVQFPLYEQLKEYLRGASFCL